MDYPGLADSPSPPPTSSNNPFAQRVQQQIYQPRSEHGFFNQQQPQVQRPPVLPLNPYAWAPTGGSYSAMDYAATARVESRNGMGSDTSFQASSSPRGNRYDFLDFSTANADEPIPRQPPSVERPPRNYSAGEFFGGSASSATIGGGVSIQHGQRGYVDFFEMQMRQLAEQQQQQFYNERTQTPPRPPISSLASTPSSSGSGMGGQQIVMNHPTHSGNSSRKRRFNQITPGLPMSSYDHNQPQQQPHSFFTQPNNGGPHSSSKRPRIGLVSYSSVPPWIQKTLADEARHFADRDTQQNPLFEKANRNSILEMRQESAFIDSLDPSIANNLGHSKRLLNIEINKIDAQLNPEWLELDMNRTIKLCRQVLIPIHRHPTVNFVGRILGQRGSTLNRICKKYKCYIAILGANSTKNRKRELHLLNSGDPNYQHFGSPLHVRIDLFAPAHIAHMRMGAVLNLFHKMLQPDYFNVEEFLGSVDLAYNEERDSRPRTKEARSDKINKEMHDLEAEFQLDQFQQKVEPGGENAQQQNAVEVYSPNPDEQIGLENHNNGSGNTISNNIPPQPQQDPQQKQVGNAEEENNDNSKQQLKADLVEEKEEQQPKPSESLPNLSDAPSTSSASFPPAIPMGSARGGRGRGGGFVPKGMRERIILQMQREQQQRMAMEKRVEPEEKADQSDGDC